jgi:DNA processing protein
MTTDDIAISLQRGMGPKVVAHLIAAMGTAADIYAATEEELTERCGLKPELARSILRKEHHREAEAELKYMKKHGIEAVASTDGDYPAMLRECVDYPHVLYVRGNAGALGRRTLSMVGTRTITPYGQRMCDVLVGRVAEIAPGTAIVSGLAFGVDAHSHRAALKYGLPTVAVVANALPGVTPALNSSLADEIVAAGGAIVTELHSGTKQNGAYYMARNRIIAGMSEGTVVVESAVGGGSMSTAGMALGYERIVMAVPGRAGDRCSEGANMLIRRRQAAMVCSGDDMIHELGWDIAVAGKVPVHARETVTLSADERLLTGCFGEGEAVDMDTLSARSGIAIGQVSAMLMNLEIGGVVRALPGKRYEKN